MPIMGAAIPAALAVCILPALRLRYGNVCFLSGELNVIYTFLIALACIAVIDSLKRTDTSLVLTGLSLAAAAAAVYFMGRNADFGLTGIPYILALYYLPDKPVITGLCTALWGLVCYGLLDSSWMFCLATILPAVILCLYRGGQGLSGRKFKLFYYYFYPVHLALLGLAFLL